MGCQDSPGLPNIGRLSNDLLAQVGPEGVHNASGQGGCALKKNMVCPLGEIGKHSRFLRCRLALQRFDSLSRSHKICRICLPVQVRQRAPIISL